MNGADQDLEFPFPAGLNFAKDMGSGYSLKWSPYKDEPRLQGNLKAKAKQPFVCVETCEATTTALPPMSGGSCGKDWVQLEDKDQTCIL